MNDLQTLIDNYLYYCKNQKRLDQKTLKAYRIDLCQFMESISVSHVSNIDVPVLENYISSLHSKYKAKTVKRKLASVKALFHYFEYRNIFDKNPFNKIQLKFREPATLPRVIPLHTIETLLSVIYRQCDEAPTKYQQKNALRDAAVIELLFATGIRISELCSLKKDDINLQDQCILIYGKGAKERRLQIGNHDVIHVLEEYKQEFLPQIQNCNYFFVNQNGCVLSDQCVRRAINKYASIAAIELHITPHMFRHTFATSLLEADVDIRYIQEMLGHSSIHITEIYTHVAMSKQRNILTEKHPRNHFHI